MEGLHCLKTLSEKGSRRQVSISGLLFFPSQFTNPLKGFSVSSGAPNTTFLGPPFGLNSAPQIFTKLLKPVATFLRKHGYQIIIYLDIFLLQGGSLASHSNDVKSTAVPGLSHTLDEINTILTRTITYLGFVINLQNIIKYSN